MTVTDGDILKCVATIDLPLDVKAQNVFYFHAEFGVDYSDSVVLAAVVDAIEAFFDELTGSIATTVALSDVVVSKWLWDAVNLWHTGSFVGQAALTDSFAAGGDMMPHATAAIIVGGTADPLVVSRKSVAGFVEGSQGNSTLSAGSLTEMAAAAVAWITSQIVTGSDLLVPGVPAKGGFWQDLLIATVADIVGSQRRRKPGVGI